MQLVHVDAIEAKSLQAALDGLAEVRRASIMRPLVRSRAIPSALGRDHKIRGVRRQCFSDQFFADVGTIRICGIYKIDTEIDGATQNVDCGRGILRRPQIPSPVIRMAPKPIRWTLSAPPSDTVPL